MLARARNHLLFAALDDEDWVLWLDVDVVDSPDILERLMQSSVISSIRIASSSPAGQLSTSTPGATAAEPA